MIALETFAPLHIGIWAGCFKVEGMVACQSRHDYFSKVTIYQKNKKKDCPIKNELTSNITQPFWFAHGGQWTILDTYTFYGEGHTSRIWGVYIWPTNIWWHCFSPYNVISMYIRILFAICKYTNIYKRKKSCFLPGFPSQCCVPEKRMQ